MPEYTWLIKLIHRNLMPVDLTENAIPGDQIRAAHIGK